jgi:hypothetical protein
VQRRHGRGEIVLADTGVKVDMINAIGQIVSKGEALGPNQVKVSFV